MHAEHDALHRSAVPHADANASHPWRVDVVLFEAARSTATVLLAPASAPAAHEARQRFYGATLLTAAPIAGIRRLKLPRHYPSDGRDD
jgi:hypothetical protein